jgi:hypothetical protein
MGMVVHAWNYLADGSRKIAVWGQPREKVSETLSQQWAGRMPIAIIPGSWEVEIEGSQFKANPDLCARPYL